MITEIKKQITQILTQIKKKPKEIVGVDIAEGQITVVVLSTTPELAIKDIATKKIPSSQTDDELSKIIEEIFAQRRLFKKEVWLNIDSLEPPMVFRRLSLPVMPQSELPNAIRWNLKDKVSLDIKDAELAYEVIGEIKKEDGSRSLDIISVVVQRTLIDKSLNIFKKAGINLSGINVTPFSISNVLKMDKGLAEKKGPILVCHVRTEYSDICFYLNGKLGFVRRIPMGVSSFLNAMTGVLVSDKGRVELTLNDAKKILEEFGLPKEADVILGGRIAPAQVIAMVRHVIERFVGEISRSVDYYQREFNGAKLEQVLLTGEGSYIKGFCDFIAKDLNLNVEYLKLPEGLLCAASYGAAIGYNGAINLLPFQLKAKKQEEMKITVVRLSTVALLGALFLSFLSINLQIKNYIKELELVKKQRATLNGLKEMQDKIDARCNIVACVREGEVPVDLVLKELSAITPGNIVFSELWLKQKDKSLGLNGKVSARPEVVQKVLSDYMEVLEKSIFFKEANLTNLRREGSQDSGIWAFEVDCVLE